MISELDKKLVEKYPIIFQDRYGDMRSTAMCWGFECGDGWYPLIDPLCRHLQFNTDNNNKSYVIENKTLRILIPFLRYLFMKIPGKYNLFRKRQINPLVYIRSFLVGLIDKWRRNLKFTYIESGRYSQVVATQVKEKHGGLRFHGRGGSDAQYAAISFAESLSYHICESCGSMKDVGRTEGWIYTRCKECAEKENLMSSWKSNEDHNKEINNDE